MLFTTHSGFGGFGAVSAELVDLNTRVDRCLRLQANNGFTNDDSGASNNLFCTSTVLGDEPLAVLRKIEKLSFLDDVDNRLLFDIARKLLGWRAMGMAGGVDRNEAEVRRIATQKLTEVGTLSPGVAILQMSSAARAESDNGVLLRLINGMAQLISPTTAANIRTEAITTLKTLLVNPDPPVRKSAEVALQIVDPQPGIEIGPAVVTPVKNPLPGFVVPLVAMTGTAIASAGVLWYFFGRHATTQLSAPGPLRRRAEAQQRRRRVRR